MTQFAQPPAAFDHRFDFRRRQAERAFKLLIKRYGVPCRIYFPISLDSHRTGSDDAISYPNEPDLIVSTIIPSVYGGRIASSSLSLDSLVPDEKWMYLPPSQEVPPYSLIEVIVPHTDSLLNFKVDMPKQTPGTLVLVNAYQLVPNVNRLTKNSILLEEPLPTIDDPDVPSDPTDWGSNPYDHAGGPGAPGEIVGETLAERDTEPVDLVLSVGDGFERRRRRYIPIPTVTEGSE